VTCNLSTMSSLIGRPRSDLYSVTGYFFFLHSISSNVLYVTCSFVCVIVRLGFFERKHQFYSQTQLANEITTHYSQQVNALILFPLVIMKHSFEVCRKYHFNVRSKICSPAES
jgi:hypothetical protein